MGFFCHYEYQKTMENQKKTTATSVPTLTQRIEKLAEFMYSADNSHDVPFRLALTYGIGGVDLDQDTFIKLMLFLLTAVPSKETFEQFLGELENEF